MIIYKNKLHIPQIGLAPVIHLNQYERFIVLEFRVDVQQATINDVTSYFGSNVSISLEGKIPNGDQFHYNPLIGIGSDFSVIRFYLYDTSSENTGNLTNLSGEFGGEVIFSVGNTRVASCNVWFVVEPHA